MHLTKSELDIMEVLWTAEKPLSRGELLASAEKERSWQDSSIHVLLNGLLKKGAIQEAGFIRTGKGFGRTYEPAMSCEEYYSITITQPKRVMPKLTLLVSKLFESQTFDDETISELEAILEEHREKR